MWARRASNISHGYDRRTLLGLALGLVVVFFGLLWVQSARAGKIEILGGEEARTVELTPGHNRGGLQGQVTLLVRNASQKPAKLKVGFVRRGKANTIRLSGHSRRVTLETKGRAQRPLRLSKRQVRPLLIHFDLAPGQGPAAADGTLVLRLKGEAKAVELVGALRRFRAVSVEPESLIMDSDRDTATVTLSGAGLVGFLSSAGSVAASATLHDEAGHTTGIKVLLPPASKVAASESPDRADATVELTDADPPAGKYTGKVPLSSLSPGASAVAVELHSHRDFACLVALVLVGVLFGGLLTQLVTLAMRRSLLLKALDQSMAAYRQVLQSGPTRSWRLEDLLNEPPSAGGENRLQGVPGLISSIETARSSKDLDEDTARVLDTVARIQRWLRLEPAARRMTMVASVPAPPALGGLAWVDSKTWRDTKALIEAAKREPVTVPDADALLARLLSQTRWHHHLAQVWSAVSASGDLELTTKLKEIDALLADTSTVETRKPEEQDVLDAKLLAFVRGTAASLGIGLSDPPTPAEPGEAAGITPVRWLASPNLFTGWATLDAQSYGQLARRAATSARSLAVPNLITEFRALGWVDVGWTLVTLLLTSIAYGLTKYGNTWGSTEDLAAAFLAGVLGTVTVKWAALPIFQSIRLQAAPKAG